MAYCGICQTYYVDYTFHICSFKAQPLPLQYEALNNLIGVEPFKTDAVEKEIRGGFATAKQKVELKPLRVLFGTDKIPSGSFVYVRGDLCVEADAKKIYEVDGYKVIFINASEAKLVRRWDPAPISQSGSITTATVTEEKG